MNSSLLGTADFWLVVTTGISGAVSSVLIWRGGATIEEVGDGKSMFSLEGKDLVWDFHNLLGLFQTDVSPRIKVMPFYPKLVHFYRFP